MHNMPKQSQGSVRPKRTLHHNIAGGDTSFQHGGCGSGRCGCGHNEHGHQNAFQEVPEKAGGACGRDSNCGNAGGCGCGREGGCICGRNQKACACTGDCQCEEKMMMVRGGCCGGGCQC